MALPSRPRPESSGSSNQSSNDSSLPDLELPKLPPVAPAAKIEPTVPEPAPSAPPTSGNPYDNEDAFTPLSSDELDELEDEEPYVAPDLTSVNSPESSHSILADQSHEAMVAKVRKDMERERAEELEAQREELRQREVEAEERERQAGLKDKKGQNVFVDRKEKKLKPFGSGKGSKTKIKTDDLDRRKNLNKRAKYIQYAVIGILVVIALAGLKNAVIPPESLGEEQVVGLVQQTVQQTNFPLERGQGFAEDFMQAYLTVNSDEISNAVLSYYYNGEFTVGGGTVPTRTSSGTYTQSLLYGPTVYDARYLTDSSGAYTIGALVQPAPSEGEQPPADGSSSRWEFFNVNVYFDEELDQFAVTPDSPTLIPTPNVLGTRNAPAPAILGDGESNPELDAAVRSTVLGFMQGYATSTPEDHTALDQYLASSAGQELMTGLGGVYELSSQSSDPVTWQAFNAPNNEVKVKVKVAWKTTAGSESARNEYISNYIMTLVPTSENGYAVNRFAPEYFFPAE